MENYENTEQQQVENTESTQEPTQATSMGEAVEESPTQAEAKPTDSDKEKNFRALREQAERAEKYERELEKMRKKMEELESRHQPKTESPKEEEYNLNPDDLVEGKHLSKYEKKLKALENQWYQQSAEQRLRSQYKDFDKVVNEDTIKKLNELHPDIANTLKAPSDLYDKGSAAYNIIKNMGIYQEDKYVQEKQQAQDNAAKPRPLASVSPQQGDSPLSKANAFANGLTDDLKKQLHKEMVNSIKNR